MKEDSLNRAGFTLVELLVVISIIAMLLSILMPSLSNARQQAKSLVCRNNLKQLWIGWHLYSNDNNDRLCERDDWANKWIGASDPEYNTDLALKTGRLWPYVEEAKLYKCQSYKGWLNRQYFVSCAMGTMGSLGCRDSLYIKMPDIDNPTERIVYLEGAIYRDFDKYGTPETLRNCYIIDRKNYNIWHDMTSRPAVRHNEGNNLVFADGHVEYYKYQDSRTIKYLKWKMANIDASENNEDLKTLKHWMNAEKAIETNKDCLGI